MSEKLCTHIISKKLIFVLFICSGILLTFSYFDHAKILSYEMLVSSDMTRVTEPKVNNFSDDHYLVSSSKCRMINLEPFSKDANKYFKPLKYKSCSKTQLLTYVTKEGNIATVHIDNKIVSDYTNKNISCCYSDVIRDSSAKVPDDTIKLTHCNQFKNNVTLNHEAILIRCTENGSKKKIYENVHSSIRISPNVQKKIDNFVNVTQKPLSVLFIGIDSISRLNFIRALPKTYEYVQNNGWLTLKGYNKIDDNTFPNLMAILTGFNSTTAYEICKPQTKGSLDKCPFIWYRYRDFGYVTAYAEDQSNIGTFNYNKKGFINPPTDYYFRPYIMATEKLNKVSVSSLSYCTGPETAGERILNLIKDFGNTFMNNPHFGFFWMNTFSHNELSTPSMMDNKVKTLLTDLESSGATNNTLIIFLSDHGIRFGDIRLTQTGWLEERLPFIYFSFPQWFRDKFPNEIQTMRNNENKLTTPFDLYMTLQHILVLSGFNYTIVPSKDCPDCVSLFTEVPSERSCEDASITEHWCTCVGYMEAKLERKIEDKLSSFFLEVLNKIVSPKADKCAKYSVERMTTRISHTLSYKNTSSVLINVETIPKAIFEATIIYEGDIMNSTLRLGPVSRLDYYNPHSHCVSSAYLKKYCYCK